MGVSHPPVSQRSVANTSKQPYCLLFACRRSSRASIQSAIQGEWVFTRRIDDCAKPQAPGVSQAALVSARKPSFRGEICANSWHPGRDFGTDRRRRRRLTSCGIAKGSKSARMSCFQGQEDRAVSCRLGIQLGYQGRLVRRRVVVVCVPASAGSTRCDAGWPPAPTRQPYARNRPHHGCELGRVPDAPTH